MKDILHADMNNFFASCEMATDPSLAGRPLVVGGNAAERRGIVLAKNYLAKGLGIKTAMTLKDALKICPTLKIVESHMDKYNFYSKKVQEIFLRFTNLVEPFSIDECFLDVTGSKIFGSPVDIADKLRLAVKEELNLTMSVGVSYNKTFAKIGSDLKKPDATTVITPKNYKEIIWALNVDAMCGIGRATTEKLKNYGINTLGELANTDVAVLKRLFGKVGEYMYINANGNGDDTVSDYYSGGEAQKSVGNSTTFPRDLTRKDEIMLAFTVIAESIVERMTRYGLPSAETLHIVVRDDKLQMFGKQCKLPFPCRDSGIFAKTAMKLFDDGYVGRMYIRMLGISVSGFEAVRQVSIFDGDKERKSFDEVVIGIRTKFGKGALARASTLTDLQIAHSMDRETAEKRNTDGDENLDE